MYMETILKYRRLELLGGNMCKNEANQVINEITILMGTHDKTVAEAEKSLKDLREINQSLSQALNQLLEIGIEKQEKVRIRTTR